MDCPRCGVTNDDSRSSCSECYAPLKAGSVATQRPAPRPTAGPATERSNQAPRPTYRPASSSSSGAGKVVPVIAVVVILGLVAAWWFFLFNPSPVSAAKTYVDSKLEAQGGKDKADIVYDGFTVNGSTADVNITVKVKSGALPAGITIPDMKQTIILAREGSFIRREWKVDEQATAKKAMESIRENVGRVLGGMMKGMSGMPKMR